MFKEVTAPNRESYDAADLNIHSTIKLICAAAFQRALVGWTCMNAIEKAHQMRTTRAIAYQRRHCL